MKTCALVTLYKPDSSVRNNVVSLAKQVSKLILIDNTENTENSAIFRGFDNCAYIWNGENFGLSVAFNRALKNLPAAKDSDYILFFDQDSCVTENLVSTLVHDFEEIAKADKIGCLGAVYFDSVKGEYGGISRLGKEICENCFEVTELITSAMITKYSILEEVGFWNENIFLDYADFDLCWRLGQIGYKSFISKNAILNHSLGFGFLKVNFFGKTLNMSYSPPFREYYQTRAAVKLLLKSYVPLRWKKNFLFNIFCRIWIFSINLPNGKKRFRYFLKGVKDGLLHKNDAYTSKELVK